MMHEQFSTVLPNISHLIVNISKLQFSVTAKMRRMLDHQLTLRIHAATAAKRAFGVIKGESDALHKRLHTEETD